MRTIADPEVLESLLDRLGRLTPDSRPRWGSLTASELMTHLSDVTDSALGRRVPPGPPPDGIPRPFFKWLVLWSPMPMPKGVPTRPGFDPRREGSRPTDFAVDRAHVIGGLRALAALREPLTMPHHGRFGPMSVRDWQRQGWKHTDHHLRQFGL